MEDNTPNYDLRTKTEEEIAVFWKGFDDSFFNRPYCNSYRQELWKMYDAGFSWGFSVKSNRGI